jgi:hypothetical protein
VEEVAGVGAGAGAGAGAGNGGSFPRQVGLLTVVARRRATAANGSTSHAQGLYLLLAVTNNKRLQER